MRFPNFYHSLTYLLPTHFRIKENVRHDTAVGQVQAFDAGTGPNANIYQHILAGNEGNWFYIDRTHGFVYNRVVLDREIRHIYDLLVKATNDHLYLITQVNVYLTNILKTFDIFEILL